MATIELNNNQLQLIQRALDFYSRVGIGQFTEIKDHPTFERHLYKQCEVDGKTDYSEYHRLRDEVDEQLNVARNMLYNEFTMSHNGSWGIYNPKVDDSCREAFEMIQVIRHEFWKANPKRSSVTVDSSVDGWIKDKINVELDK